MPEPKLDDAALVAVVKVATEALEAQTHLFRDQETALPPVSKDNWSLGYVGGITDAILQAKNLSPDDLDAWGVMTFVFISLFGETEGPTLFGKLMDLQAQQDAELMSGMQTGGSEFFAWRNNHRKIPLGWASHVLGIKKTRITSD